MTRKRHRADLDGLRGLAILGVLGFHSAFLFGGPSLTGGFLGVDLFFVLSGFLITSLLIDERRTSGAVDISAFYARRALRLLPALSLALLLAWTVTAGTHHPSEWMTYPKAVLPVIGYVGNWFKDEIGVLAHTWSLALEEQYYIVWPTVLIVALRRGLTPRKIAGVLLGVTFGLVVFQATWGSVFRPHLSPLVWSGLMTYGRFGGLLLGSIVALVPEKLRWARDRRVAYASGICVVALVFGHFSSWVYERIGIVLFALMAAIVIAHVVHAPGSPVARGLSAWPLGVVGKISYGLYLYHYPLFWFISKHFSHTVVVVVLAWISAFACAIVSYAFVERRVLRAKARVGRRRAARMLRATVPVESPIATS